MRLDRIVHAGQIITLDPGRPTAGQMGVLGGRIVGFDEELAGCDAAVVDDFGNQVVVPGFIDAHCHTTWWGLGLSALDLETARGLDELYAQVAGEVRRLDGAPDAWVHAIGFNHNNFGGAFPDLARLDEITGDRPLYIRHISGHQAVTNSVTLRLAGVLEPGFVDPVGGAVRRDAHGRPTGVIEESAQALVQNLLLPYSVPQIVEALDNATRRYARRGITSFTEAGIAAGWIGHSPIEIDAYVTARRTGRLHARAQLMPTIDALHEISGHHSDLYGETGRGLDLGLTAGFGDDWVSLGPVKVFTDGSLLGATAAVTEEFCTNEHTTGYLLDTPDTYRARVRAAYRAGWPVAMHAIGDAAIDLALEIITGCQDDYGPRALPNRIEHFGMARPDQVLRAAAARIVVTPQASFIRSIGDQMAAMVGDRREGWLYRGRSLVDAGLVVAGSSDLPVASNDVLRAMQSAVDRRTESGHVLGGPGECLNPEQALRSNTEWAAIGTGTIGSRGTLSPGKLADLVVLSGSPLETDDIGSLRVVATMVDGQFSHDTR